MIRTHVVLSAAMPEPKDAEPSALSGIENFDIFTILRDHPIPDSYSSPHKIQSYLEATQLEINRIDFEIAHLQEKRASIQRCAEACGAFNAPVRYLPDDVLLEIFQHLSSGVAICNGKNRRPFKVSTSLSSFIAVCHRWRTVILSGKALWTNIRYTEIACKLISDQAGEEAVRFYLSLSGKYPLSVYIEDDMPKMRSREIMQHLIRESHRISDFSFEGFSPLLSSLLRPHGSIIFPVLKKLNLRMRGAPISRSPGFQDAPLLEEVILRSVSAQHISLPWSKIHRLAIDDLPILSILNDIPRFTSLVDLRLTLRFPMSRIDEEEYDRMYGFEIPFLQHLTLVLPPQCSECDPEYKAHVPANRLFRVITCRSLKTLTLKEDESAHDTHKGSDGKTHFQFNGTAFLEFLSCCQHLDALSLSRLCIDEGELLDILLYTPSISSFTFIEANTYEIPLKYPIFRIHSSLLCQPLSRGKNRSLSSTHLDLETTIVGIDHVLPMWDMVESRWKKISPQTISPLQYLRVVGLGDVYVGNSSIDAVVTHFKKEYGLQIVVI